MRHTSTRVARVLVKQFVALAGARRTLAPAMRANNGGAERRCRQHRETGASAVHHRPTRALS
jgi:hypothetical protein